MSATSLGVAPSGERLRGEGPVWLIGAVVCLLAAAEGPMSVSAGNGQNHWLLPINRHFEIVKRDVLVRRVSRAI